MPPRANRRAGNAIANAPGYHGLLQQGLQVAATAVATTITGGVYNAINSFFASYSSLANVEPVTIISSIPDAISSVNSTVSVILRPTSFLYSTPAATCSWKDQYYAVISETITNQTTVPAQCGPFGCFNNPVLSFFSFLWNMFVSNNHFFQLISTIAASIIMGLVTKMFFRLSDGSDTDIHEQLRVMKEQIQDMSQYMINSNKRNNIEDSNHPLVQVIVTELTKTLRDSIGLNPAVNELQQAVKNTISEIEPSLRQTMLGLVSNEENRFKKLVDSAVSKVQHTLSVDAEKVVKDLQSTVTSTISSTVTSTISATVSSTINDAIAKLSQPEPVDFKALQADIKRIVSEEQSRILNPITEAISDLSQSKIDHDTLVKQIESSVHGVVSKEMRKLPSQPDLSHLEDVPKVLRQLNEKVKELASNKPDLSYLQNVPSALKLIAEKVKVLANNKPYLSDLQNIPSVLQQLNEKIKELANKQPELNEAVLTKHATSVVEASIPRYTKVVSGAFEAVAIRYGTVKETLEDIKAGMDLNNQSGNQKLVKLEASITSHIKAMNQQDSSRMVTIEKLVNLALEKKLSGMSIPVNQELVGKVMAMEAEMKNSLQHQNEQALVVQRVGEFLEFFSAKIAEQQPKNEEMLTMLRALAARETVPSSFDSTAGLNNMQFDINNFDFDAELKATLDAIEVPQPVTAEPNGLQPVTYVPSVTGDFTASQPVTSVPVTVADIPTAQLVLSVPEITAGQAMSNTVTVDTKPPQDTAAGAVPSMPNTPITPHPDQNVMSIAPAKPLFPEVPQELNTVTPAPKDTSSNMLLVTNMAIPQPATGNFNALASSLAPSAVTSDIVASAALTQPAADPNTQVPLVDHPNLTYTDTQLADMLEDILPRSPEAENMDLGLTDDQWNTIMGDNFIWNLHPDLQGSQQGEVDQAMTDVQQEQGNEASCQEQQDDDFDSLFDEPRTTAAPQDTAMTESSAALLPNNLDVMDISDPKGEVATPNSSSNAQQQATVMTETGHNGSASLPPPSTAMELTDAPSAQPEANVSQIVDSGGSFNMSALSNALEDIPVTKAAVSSPNRGVTATPAVDPAQPQPQAGPSNPVPPRRPARQQLPICLRPNIRETNVRARRDQIRAALAQTNPPNSTLGDATGTAPQLGAAGTLASSRFATATSSSNALHTVSNDVTGRLASSTVSTPPPSSATRTTPRDVKTGGLASSRFATASPSPNASHTVSNDVTGGLASSTVSTPPPSSATRTTPRDVKTGGLASSRFATASPSPNVTLTVPTRIVPSEATIRPNVGSSTPYATSNASPSVPGDSSGGLASSRFATNSPANGATNRPILTAATTTSTNTRISSSSNTGLAASRYANSAANHQTSNPPSSINMSTTAPSSSLQSSRFANMRSTVGQQSASTPPNLRNGENHQGENPNLASVPMRVSL
jgi:hypothetical protein